MRRSTTTPPADGFDCFPHETLEFFRALATNNTRAWFAANKPAYERTLKVPAEQFCAAMSQGLEQLTGQRHTAKIYRIHRDVRFSKDKTPYNAHLHISFIPERSVHVPPAWMFGVDQERLSLGAGIFAFEATALDAFRKRTQRADGLRLHKLLERLSRTGIRISEPELKRVPSGFDPGSAPGDLLQRKGLTAWIEHDTTPEAIASCGLVDRCMADFRRLKPLVDWLADA